jgi:tetratricopeptide (TPR) repeat protein
MWSGNYDEAESLMEEAVVTLRQVDDSGLTVALANLGNVLHSLDKVDRAAATLDEALANGERRGDIWASVVILQGQSRLERERGNLPRARASMQRAMLLHRDLLDPRYIAQALEECAWLAVSEGATAHAARLLGAASRLRESIGVPALGQIRQAYERHLPTARAQLNAADWERAWSDGRALSQADAIDVALQGLE